MALRTETCPTCGQLRNVDAATSNTGVHHLGWEDHDRRGTDAHRDEQLEQMRKDGDTTEGDDW